MSWKSAVYLAIFDLNQWYQAQMPSRWIFEDMSRLCPFMGFYHVQVGGGSVRQVWIQSETLSIFHRSSTTPSEAFFYPSALSFRAVVVGPQEAEIVLFLGIQSLLLQKLSQAGSQVLSHPHRFYVQVRRFIPVLFLWIALQKFTFWHCRPWRLASHLQRLLHPMQPRWPKLYWILGWRIILDPFWYPALRYVLVKKKCASTWLNSIYFFQDEGANLNFVEKWAWQQVVNLKSLRENLCHILFDHSTQEMEHQVSKF